MRRSSRTSRSGVRLPKGNRKPAFAPPKGYVWIPKGKNFELVSKRSTFAVGPKGVVTKPTFRPKQLSHVDITRLHSPPPETMWVKTVEGYRLRRLQASAHPEIGKAGHPVQSVRTRNEDPTLRMGTLVVQPVHPAFVPSELIRLIGDMRQKGLSPAKIGHTLASTYGERLPAHFRQPIEIAQWVTEVFPTTNPVQVKKILAVVAASTKGHHSKKSGLHLDKRLSGLLTENQGLLYYFCKRYGRDLLRRIGAEDLLQHVNTELLQVMDQYDGKHKLSTFLSYKIRSIVTRLRRSIKSAKHGGELRIKSLSGSKEGFSSIQEEIEGKWGRAGINELESSDAMKTIDAAALTLLSPRDWDIYKMMVLGGAALQVPAAKYKISLERARQISVKVGKILKQNPQMRHLLVRATTEK
jgi:RNA polymerase sigma factor (sigma-70 family)